MINTATGTKDAYVHPDYASAAYDDDNNAADFFDNYGPFDGIKRDTWERGVRMATLAWWPGMIASNSISM